MTTHDKIVHIPNGASKITVLFDAGLSQCELVGAQALTERTLSEYLISVMLCRILNVSWSALAPTERILSSLSSGRGLTIYLVFSVLKNEC